MHDADDPGGARPVRPRQAVHQHAAAPRQPRLGEGEQRPEEGGEVPDVVPDVTPPAADIRADSKDNLASRLGTRRARA